MAPRRHHRLALDDGSLVVALHQFGYLGPVSYNYKVLKNSN